MEVPPTETVRRAKYLKFQRSLFVRVAQYLAGCQIDHVDPIAHDAVHRLVQVIVRCLFRAEALGAKAGSRATIEESCHLPSDVVETT